MGTTNEHAVQMEELRELMVEGLRSGEVQPLPYTTHASDDVPVAFRFMASGTARTHYLHTNLPRQDA